MFNHSYSATSELWQKSCGIIYDPRTIDFHLFIILLNLYHLHLLSFVVKLIIVLAFFIWLINGDLNN